jgi:hypothetical protein
VQVHGSMNQTYELFVTNGTRPKDIKKISLWKYFSSTHK